MLLRPFLAILLASAALQAASLPAVFSQMDQMTTTLGEITGWPIKKKVPSEILTKEKF